jgi:ABC-type polysaccharide/polyol phosphate transport system ATPase subunit
MPVIDATASPPGSAVIVADGVWKQYETRSHSLRNDASTLVRQALRRHIVGEEPFWALRDVSLRVARGESIAIVGRNGSGKSTLLRILSGITQPTRGTALIRGHFATLLGIGAGFYPERSGRENIFLHAAMQGVSPRDARSYVDEIADWAELGDFIDVAVKRYSSGMMTRLGFSIAVHIAPDIVFVDEVLAVGDKGFRDKCTDRLLGMRKEGRTLVCVSHQAETLQRLCDRAILLHRGEMRGEGTVKEVMSQYDSMLKAAPDESGHATHLAGVSG